MSTGIEWTGETWNPTTGCDQVSPGCDNCYAKTLAGRLKAMGQAKYQRDGDPRTSGPGFGLTLHPDALAIPLRRRKPTTWFVDSMSDLFHPEVPDEFIHLVWSKMAVTPRHTYQILTKRPQRAATFLSTAVERWGSGPMCVLSNVWLGTSIESDRYVWRADHLRRTPAAVRFLSLEPLLGPLPSLRLDDTCSRCGGVGVLPGTNSSSNLKSDPPNCFHCNGTGKVDGRIDWVITGGESGPNARPMDPAWVRDIRDRCIETGVPFFHKQWGGRTPKAGGRELDGRTWDEMPEHAGAVA